MIDIYETMLNNDESWYCTRDGLAVLMQNKEYFIEN